MRKRVSESRTEQVQILSQSTLNGYKRLFGGKLMEWIDIVAAVTARRHSGKNVTTAAVDSLEFTSAAYANDTIVLIGTVTYVGTTSMEICVKTYVEALSGERRLINNAYVIMVALDENECPAQVPGLICETEEERREWRMGKLRNEARKQRRNQQSNHSDNA
jgi:acyl-CoA hydrolase